MPRVRLLDALPEFAEGLAGDRAEEARRTLLVETETLHRGAWEPNRNEPEPGALGLVIIEGVIGRGLSVAGASSIELLSRGDVLRPWLEDSASFAAAEWQVLERTEIAILDRRFATLAGRWPELIAVFVDRAMQRSRSLAVHAAIENMVGLDKRLLVLFWLLAERWGVREQDAIVIPLRLTHSTLATLVGARRPSVTMALGSLERQGVLQRRGREWVLNGEQPHVDEKTEVPRRFEAQPAGE
jgi:CRP/FNR family cyclic AMP-dependent transcriptional regulator